jgi:nitroreductase
MDALELLVNRQSVAKLQFPYPKGESLDRIKAAALRAPDHACLTPWRFIVCCEQGNVRLGELMKQTAVEENWSEKDIERAPLLPLRAPMVIIAISKHIHHEKVPPIEQIASTSCAVYAMQLAAKAQGFDSMWRTGKYAFSEIMKAKLDMLESESIVGFLYLGTAPIQFPRRKPRDTNDYFEHWE